MPAGRAIRLALLTTLWAVAAKAVLSSPPLPCPRVVCLPCSLQKLSAELSRRFSRCFEVGAGDGYGLADGVVQDAARLSERVAAVAGIGLHTGVPVNLRLQPASSNTGIVFRRTDLDGFEIEACARNVARVSYATSLMRKGVLISTTEHLLSALASVNVDNVYVELDNLEVPILDGSALPFVRLIAGAGLKRQRARRKYAIASRWAWRWALSTPRG